MHAGRAPFRCVDQGSLRILGIVPFGARLGIRFEIPPWWVVTVPAPRVAASDAMDGEDKASHRAILVQCLKRVFGTGRCETAGCSQVRRKNQAIKPYAALEQISGESIYNACHIACGRSRPKRRFLPDPERARRRRQAPHDGMALMSGDLCPVAGLVASVRPVNGQCTRHSPMPA